jgi:hypothetical protein
MCPLRTKEDPRDKKKKYIHIEKVFISLKICNSNYCSVKVLIQSENRFNAISPTASKERKQFYRVGEKLITVLPIPVVNTNVRNSFLYKIRTHTVCIPTHTQQILRFSATSG